MKPFDSLAFQRGLVVVEVFLIHAKTAEDPAQACSQVRIPPSMLLIGFSLASKYCATAPSSEITQGRAKICQKGNQ